MKKLILIFIVLSVLLLTSCYDSEDMAEQYDEGYEAGYKNGYDQGQYDEYSGATYYSAYYEIDDMTSTEIFEYLRDQISDDEIFYYLTEHSDNHYWSDEDVYPFLAYTYRKGYLDCKNGNWSDMSDEYVNGYDYSDEESAYYDWKLGFGP